MSGLSDFFDIQGSHGVSRKHNEASSFVLVRRLDDTSLTRAHWLAKGEGDAEGFEGHSFSPFYTYNITPGGVKVKDLVVKRMSDSLQQNDKTGEQKRIKLDHQTNEVT